MCAVCAVVGAARRLEKYRGAVMTKKKDGDGTVQVEMSSGNSKSVGGGEQEAWNLRIMRQVLNALPLDHGDKADVKEVAAAVFSGMVDLKSTDPIEGMLASQLVVAHEAALRMFQRAWIQDNFDIKARYLALADKAQRTVALLTERLDRHRNSGQQQITVKHQHVTVHADQAIVGNVERHQGAGSPSKSEDQPHAIAYAPGITMPSADQGWQPVSVARDEKRPVPDAWRDITGRTKGK